MPMSGAIWLAVAAGIATVIAVVSKFFGRNAMTLLTKPEAETLVKQASSVAKDYRRLLKSTHDHER